MENTLNIVRLVFYCAFILFIVISLIWKIIDRYREKQADKAAEKFFDEIHQGINKWKEEITKPKVKRPRKSKQSGAKVVKIKAKEPKIVVDYSAKNMKELRSIAKEKGVKNPTTLNKASLIKAIEEKDNEK